MFWEWIDENDKKKKLTRREKKGDRFYLETDPIRLIYCYI
jgi:hypothetical protein